MIKAIWEGLGAIGHWIYEKLQTLGETAVTKVTDIDWEGLGETVIGFIVDGLAAIGSTIWETIKGFGDDAVEKFKEIDWKQLGIDVINAIVSGFASVGSAIWEGLGTIGEKAVDWLTGKDSSSGVDWKQAGKTAVDDYASGMNDKKSLDTALASIVTTVKTNLGVDTSGIGKSVVDGIIAGMKAKMEAAKQMAIALANAVTQSLTGIKAFNINSPSKLTRDKVGKPISEGVAVGILEGASMIDAAVEKVAKSTVSDLSIDTARTTTADAANNVVSPITINVYPAAGMDEKALADKVQQQLTLEMRQLKAAWG